MTRVPRVLAIGAEDKTGGQNRTRTLIPYGAVAPDARARFPRIGAADMIRVAMGIWWDFADAVRFPR